MHKRLYPPEKYPDGHPDLAGSLNNLGAAEDRGRVRQGGAATTATPWTCARRLYPPEKYPDGHPDLARSLNNLGVSC